jgi:pimeloyl-ACP methyl ester carboxylesterase
MRRIAPLLLPLFLAACQSMPVASTQSPGHRRLPKPKATILIVHGAWGGGWAFREVDSLLSADHYKVYRPTLTGQGEKVHLSTPDINLSTHIQDIVNVILFEDLHDITLVGHSYGGMVVTGVADRVPDRIRQLIYVDAVLPKSGESVNDTLPPIGRDETDGYIHPTWKVSADPPHDVLMPAKTFSEKLTFTHADALARIPAAYILTVDKGKQPESDTFYKFYQRARQYGWPTEVMEGDHNVQWSKPEELVRLLEKYAR